jgi:hypothetical protein
MDLFPDLGIEEDIKNIEMDDFDDDDLEIKPVIDKDYIPESLKEKKIEENDIFISNKPTNKQVTPCVKEISEETPQEKPLKKKRVLSEKQKEHLNKIRVLALETKKKKADAKKEAVKKINDEFPTTAYKRKKQPGGQSNKVKSEIAKQFEAKIEANKEDEIKKEKTSDEYNFLHFMNHMEKYSNMSRAYNEMNKKEKIPPPPKPQPPKPQPPKPQPPKPPVKVVQKAQPLGLNINTQPLDPYNDWFG